MENGNCATESPVKTNQIINIARDFSRFPAGRFLSDGPFSGEAFRNQYLLPVLRSGEAIVTIELDGVRGYGSSFLEEAFGGLVREGYTPEQVKSAFKLISEDLSLIDEINEYVDQGNNPQENV